MHMANRGRPAELLEPAAPPTGSGKMRMEQVGLEAAGGQGKPWDGQRFAFPPMPSRSNGRLAASSSRFAWLRLVTKWLTNWSSEARRINRAKKRFGACQFRGRDRVQHARRPLRTKRRARDTYFGAGNGCGCCRSLTALSDAELFWWATCLFGERLCGRALTRFAVGGAFVEHSFVNLFERVDESVPTKQTYCSLVRGLSHTRGPIAIGEQREQRLGNRRTVARGYQEAGLAVFDRFGRTAGAAGNARLSRERCFDIHERARLASRGQCHDVDRVHQVGDVAAEAEEADVVHHAGLLGNIVQLVPQLAFANDPELSFGNSRSTAGIAAKRSWWPFFLRR